MQRGHKMLLGRFELTMGQTHGNNRYWLCRVIQRFPANKPLPVHFSAIRRSLP
jgi:hypothetical protein